MTLNSRSLLQSECDWQQAITYCSCYRIPQNASFFLCVCVHALAIFWLAKSDGKTLFSPLITFPLSFLQTQQQWHLYCFAVLGSASTVIHSVKQRLLRKRPGSGSCDLSRLLAQKIMKGVHSCKPASLNCPITSLITPFLQILP